jgi:hypothetical protein
MKIEVGIFSFELYHSCSSASSRFVFQSHVLSSIKLHMMGILFRILHKQLQNIRNKSDPDI